MKEERSDLTALDYYMAGFHDELNGTSTIIPDDPVLEGAYDLGVAHAIAGDDLEDIDLMSGDEILKLMKNN